MGVSEILPASLHPQWSGGYSLGLHIESPIAAPPASLPHQIWNQNLQCQALYSGFFSFFFFSACIYWCVSKQATSAAPSLGYMKQKENRGNSHLCYLLGLKVPGGFAFFSPPFRLLCLFYISCMSRGFSCAQWETGKSESTPSFQKW